MNYLNTGNAYTLFEEALNNEIYVDKSMLVAKVSSKIRTVINIYASLVPGGSANP